METAIKPKNKSRPYPLRWVLLTMITGLILFMWMPVVIVSPTGIHPLTRVLYWLGVLAWLVPLARWFYLSWRIDRHPISKAIFLLALWIGLFAGAVVITFERGSPVFMLTENRCHISTGESGQTIYVCYAPDWTIGKDGNPRGCVMDCWGTHYLVARLDAERKSDLPIAIVNRMSFNFYPPSEAIKLFDFDDVIPDDCC